MSVNDLMKVRKEIMPHARKNSSRTNSAYTDMMAQCQSEAAPHDEASKKVADTMDNIIDIRYLLTSSGSLVCKLQFSFNNF